VVRNLLDYISNVSKEVSVVPVDREAQNRSNNLKYMVGSCSHCSFLEYFLNSGSCM
jgi:hypothetical protein